MVAVLFVAALLVGLLFVDAAITVWLAEWIGALGWSLFVVGMANIVVAAALYILSLRPIVTRWQQRLTMVYSVSAELDTLYRQLAQFVKKVWAALQ